MVGHSSSEATASRIHDDSVDLSRLASLSPLLLVLHNKLQAITTPLTYEQLQKNENVVLLLRVSS